MIRAIELYNMHVQIYRFDSIFSLYQEASTVYAMYEADLLSIVIAMKVKQDSGICGSLLTGAAADCQYYYFAPATMVALIQIQTCLSAFHIKTWLARPS